MNLKMELALQTRMILKYACVGFFLFFFRYSLFLKLLFYLSMLNLVPFLVTIASL